MKKLFALCTTLLLTLAVVLIVCNYSKADNSAWAGTWYRDSLKSYATIEVTNVTSNSLDFKLTASSGGNSSRLEGTAKFIENNKAVYKDNRSYSIGDIYIFELKNDTIEINYNHANVSWAMGVSPNGVYGKNPPNKNRDDNIFSEYKFLTLQQEQELKKLTGEYYSCFTESAHMFYNPEDLDGFNSKVTKTFVRGLYPYYGSIIMVRDSDDAIWAATIKGDENTIYYFTNTSTEYIPKTILAWAKDNVYKEKYPIIWKQ